MYLLRVLLPDEPGSLGAVASALGKAGADIIALDVIERGADGTAVDDVLVELPLGGRADTLVSACQSIPGVRVAWLSRYDAGGGLHRDLEAVEAMTERPRRAIDLLVELAPGVFRADWAFIVAGGPDDSRVSHSTAAAPGLPDGSAPWIPLAKPTHLSVPEPWHRHGWRDVAAAAVPIGDTDRTLVIGRHGGPDILASELARLGHLAALAATIGKAADG